MYFLRGPHTYKITPGYFGVITPGVIGVIEHGMFENQLLRGNYTVTRVIRNQEQNEARETYLNHYFGMDVAVHMIKNTANK
jgi:hypothetical protein